MYPEESSSAETHTEKLTEKQTVKREEIKEWAVPLVSALVSKKLSILFSVFSFIFYDRSNNTKSNLAFMQLKFACQYLINW